MEPNIPYKGYLIYLPMFLTHRPWTFIGFAAFITISACASPKPLSGGPKDIAPPDIIESESTPNKQTSFGERQITLTFNEWIDIKDVDAQLVISPLLPRKPEVKLKGKTLIINLPDSLKPNTTYTLNFGNAIKDINEGNPLENYSFIFSTGPFLDSISLQGHVTDALSLKPGVDAWVMLYAPGTDSIVYKQKPEYLAKVNKEGLWSIHNVRTDSFFVVVLKDENLNFIYDLGTEAFGWLDQPVYTNVSSTLPAMNVSPREKKAVIQDIIQVAPGQMVMYIPGPLPKTMPIFQPALERPSFEWISDSLYIWYSQEINYGGKVILHEDTTRIRPMETKFLKNKPLLISFLTGRLYPNEDAKIKANVPIQRIDTTLIRVSKDSMANIPFFLNRDSLSERILRIKVAWVPTSRYTIQFLPGAITDIWDRSNDTFTNTFIVNAFDQYSNLDMKIIGLDTTMHYVVQIMTGNIVDRTFHISNQSATLISSKGMQPGKYTIELIEDRNENGTWDTGNFGLRRQPERKMIFIPENLRAGWDVELKMEWKDQ